MLPQLLERAPLGPYLLLLLLEQLLLFLYILFKLLYLCAPHCACTRDEAP